MPVPVQYNTAAPHASSDPMQGSGREHADGSMGADASTSFTIERLSTEWAEAVGLERMQAQAAKRLFLQRLRRLRAGIWDPGPASNTLNRKRSSADGSRSPSETFAKAEASSTEAAAPEDLVFRSPWMTHLIVLFTVGLFFVQWWPAAPVLLESIRSFSPRPLLAFALVVPETAAAWQMVSGKA